ncbi:unnamed protein product [Rotaria socialis]|uniref:Uncharacterized protein n=1 Tax=Rotaria socialis TaxID=392032 RepID=A0A821TBC6_9BILA|nr:unnamed protein product [Rotaria socialis]
MATYSRNNTLDYNQHQLSHPCNCYWGFNVGHYIKFCPEWNKSINKNQNNKHCMDTKVNIKESKSTGINNNLNNINLALIGKPSCVEDTLNVTPIIENVIVECSLNESFYKNFRFELPNNIETELNLTKKLTNDKTLKSTSSYVNALKIKNKLCYNNNKFKLYKRQPAFRIGHFKVITGMSLNDNLVTDISHELKNELALVRLNALIGSIKIIPQFIKEIMNDIIVDAGNMYSENLTNKITIVNTQPASQDNLDINESIALNITNDTNDLKSLSENSGLIEEEFKVTSDIENECVDKLGLNESIADQLVNNVTLEKNNNNLNLNPVSLIKFEEEVNFVLPVKSKQECSVKNKVKSKGKKSKNQVNSIPQINSFSLVNNDEISPSKVNPTPYSIDQKIKSELSVSTPIERCKAINTENLYNINENEAYALEPNIITYDSVHNLNDSSSYNEFTFTRIQSPILRLSKVWSVKMPWKNKCTKVEIFLKCLCFCALNKTITTNKDFKNPNKQEIKEYIKNIKSTPIKCLHRDWEDEIWSYAEKFVKMENKRLVVYNPLLNKSEYESYFIPDVTTDTIYIVYGPGKEYENCMECTVMKSCEKSSTNKKERVEIVPYNRERLNKEEWFYDLPY